jgi:Domain of unknown function (DU1801)
LKSSAATVQQYLNELPEDRRAVVEAMREMIRHNLPEGYSESMRWGMITYEIPLERYPETYNGQPLGYLALAAQKNNYALYLTCVSQDSEQEARLREGFKKAGKKLDFGKSCLRFKKLDDLPMNVLAEVVAATPPEAYIARYEAARQG